MRVTGGSERGRRLAIPEDRVLRPTTDRVREAYFNIVGSAIQGARFLDGCAGCGAVGIEALSRGAKEATFVEKSRDYLALIRRNLQTCKFDDLATLLQRDLIEGLRTLANERRVYDVLYIDPPYESSLRESALQFLASGMLQHAGSLVTMEHSRRDQLQEGYSALFLVDERDYGETRLSFFRQESRGLEGR